MSDEDSTGFRKLSKEFKSNPTIENYVALRRRHPKETIEVALSSGIEWLFSNQDTLEFFGIPPDLVAGVLDADQDSISELSLLLLERLIERKQLERRGHTHLASRRKAISDNLVNFLISMTLDSLDWNDQLVVPRDFVVLLRERIGGEVSAWDRQQEVQELRQKAGLVAIKLLADGEISSYRAIAKVLGVNATTVMRWFPDSDWIGELRKNVSLSSTRRKKGSDPSEGK